MKNHLAFCLTVLALTSAAKVLPPPVIRPVDPRANERPIAVSNVTEVVEENAYFQRVKTSFVFTNPNPRALQGEFEFPIPEGAVVCGYALEVNGALVPGVVCPKDEARIAFENEVRQGIDPGLVEQVAENVWRTRIFPLRPETPRRAEVTIVAPRETTELSPVYERAGEEIFVATALTNVFKIAASELPEGVAPRESTLLATIWAARRMRDLAAEAESHKEEFLSLGRAYGVAGPGLSLIVLETLEQYLRYKIEPPAHLSFHDEWVRRRAAEDDPIAAKKAQADYEKRLLEYWEERVLWWNDPKPKEETPKSGLFAMNGDASEAATEWRTARRMESVASGGAAPRVDSVAFGAAAPQPAAPQPAAPAQPTIVLKPWDPKTPYLEALKAAAPEAAYDVYLAERKTYANAPAFYLDCADFFFTRGQSELACRVLANLGDLKFENPALLRTMGYRLRQAGAYDAAIAAFRKVLKLRPEEGQSYRDLALVLIEAEADLNEAARLLHKAAFTNFARRSSRRGNDFQVAILALEELNALISRCAATNRALEVPEMDEAFRRDLPVGIRIVLAWDADETDIDLHVLEPNGEEAYYGHRRTREGGFVSEDVTTGYGPEEYLAKEAQGGVYKVLTNYFASHQTTLTGPTTVQATVYTNWGSANEQRRILTLRLDKPKDKVVIGEISL